MALLSKIQSGSIYVICICDLSGTEQMSGRLCGLWVYSSSPVLTSLWRWLHKPASRPRVGAFVIQLQLFGVLSVRGIFTPLVYPVVSCFPIILDVLMFPHTLALLYVDPRFIHLVFIRLKFHFSMTGRCNQNLTTSPYSSANNKGCAAVSSRRYRGMSYAHNICWYSPVIIKQQQEKYLTTPPTMQIPISDSN